MIELDTRTRTTKHLSLGRRRRTMPPALRTLARSASAQTFAANIIILVVTLGFSIILARVLEPAGRGDLAAAMLWPNLLAYLGTAGIIESVVYFTATSSIQTPNIFAHGLLLAALVSIVLCPIGYLIMPWLLLDKHGADTVATARLFLFLIPLLALIEFSSAILLGHSRLGSYSLLRLIVPVGFLCGTVLLALTGDVTVRRVIVLHLGLTALRLVVTLGLLVAFRIPMGIRGSLPLLSDMLRYGGKAQIGSLSQMTNWRLDQLVMSKWLASSDLGLYAIAVNASQLLLTLPQAVKTVIMPRIASQTGSEGRLATLVRSFRAYWTLSIIGAPIAGIGLYFAIPFVYGSNYQGAVWPAEVLVLGALLMGAKEVLAAALRALGNPWLSSQAELTAVAITIVLLATLLPTLGIMGAAITSVAAYGVALVLVVIALSRKFHLRISELFGIELSSLEPMLKARPRPQTHESVVES